MTRRSTVLVRAPRLRSSLLLAVLGLVVGCLPPPAVDLPASRSRPPDPGPMRGGAARVDITPPAGLALFGHGPAARMAQGHRGRLRCRALVLEHGDRLALVTCDLASVSMLLHREVAARTESATGIGADRLILSATHTHAGFAHYFGSSAYNSLVSSQRPGFDPDVVEWLAERIARAVMRAAERAREGAPVVVRWDQTQLGPELSHNRSVCAHCRNADPMAGRPTSCSEPPRPLPAGGRPANACLEDGSVDPKREVDRTLAVLRVDRRGAQGRRPIALYAVFPVHATAVPNDNDLYHADLFGFAARYVEARLAATAPSDEPFVALLANSHEGDVSPSYDPQGFGETRRLGLRLGRDIVDRHQGAGEGMAAAPVQVAYGEAPLVRAPVPAEGQGEDGRLCGQAEPGTASFGGAEDGPTWLAFWPCFREGAATRDWSDDCHSPKRSLLFGLGRKTLNEHSFPTVAPLHAARIGETLLVTLPGEATTTAGLRLRRRLASIAGSEPTDRVVLVGLASGYLQYIATAAEYSAQNYEGASTLYGPWSAAFFTDRLGQLVEALDGAPLGDGWELDHVEPREARPGRPKGRWPRMQRRAVRPRIVDWHAERTRCGARYRIAWRGAPPGAVEPARGPIAWVQRYGSSERWQPARTALGYPVDDRDAEMEVRGAPVGRTPSGDVLAPSAGGAWVWTATWTPAGEVPPGRYRFRIRTDERLLTSRPWRVPQSIGGDCWEP